MDKKPWYEYKLAIALCNNQHTVPADFFWNFISIAKPSNHVVLRGQSRLKAASLNRLCEEAWRLKVDKILFMDIDQIFPFATIPKLIGRDLPIVSGLAYTVSYPYSPAAGWLKEIEKGEEKYVGKFQCVNQDGKVWKENYAPFPDNEDHLVEVDWTGVSCLLVDMEVFEKIKFPCFKELWDDEIGDRIAGHDVLFCEAVRKAGYKIYVDTLVQCGHLGQKNVDDLYVKSYYQSNLYETEEKMLKDNCQETNYWDEQYFAESIQNVKRTYNKEWEVILDQIPSDTKVAEMGCGLGNLMEVLKQNGTEPYGYDFSKMAINIVKAKGFEGEVADLRTFKPNGQSFDHVVGSHVLEHMKDDEGFLKLCASMLNNGDGKVIMSVPSNDTHPISLMEHQHNYTEETLRDVMSKVFKEVEIKPVTKEKFGVEVKPAFVAIGSHPHGV